MGQDWKIGNVDQSERTFTSSINGRLAKHDGALLGDRLMVSLLLQARPDAVGLSWSKNSQ